MSEIPTNPSNEYIGPAHEQESPFSPSPRIITFEDIEKIQKLFTDQKISSKYDQSTLLTTEVFYRAFTESTNESVEDKAPSDSFDDTTFMLLESWKEVFNPMKFQTPHSLDDARNALFNRHMLHELSPVHIQGGPLPANRNRLIHIRTGYAMGIEQEKVSLRHYLNPRADKMKYVVDYLVDKAFDNKVPLYFKFVDIASGEPDERTLRRTDRMVIFASNAQKEFIENILYTIAIENPDIFTGREITGFGEVLTDGISRADDVTKDQKNQFAISRNGISFNALRAKMMVSATMRVIEKIDIPLELAIEAAPEFIPALDTEYLTYLYRKTVAEIAPKYGIDPNNIARNL